MFNTFQFPKVYSDRYQGRLTPAEWAVVSYLIRHTNSSEAAVKTDAIVHGHKNAAGDRTDRGAGVDYRWLPNTLTALMNYGLIAPVGPDAYRLQTDAAGVDEAAIDAAYEDRRR